MPYTPILATLGYVFSPDGSEVLMIHRNKRGDDQHLGKYNGLGGKLEANENVVDGMKRELLEEAGLVIDEQRLAGTISWPGFGSGGEDWFGFIFRIDRYHGEQLENTDEGELCWVAAADVLKLPLWEGDRFFLPLVFAEPLRPFHGVMPYEDGTPLSWTFSYL